MERKALVLELEELAMRFSEGWHEGIKIDALDIVLLNEAAEALAQPAQEPVATLWQHGETGRTRITMPNDITDCDARWFKAADLYTTPPQRPWVELEGEEIRNLWEEATKPDRSTVTMVTSFARAIEAKLKEKNNGT